MIDKSKPYMHLTQLSRGNTYSENQIIDLAQQMKCLIKLPRFGCINVKNKIATFSFSLIIDDVETECDYYTLTHIKKHIPARLGASIVLTCNIKKLSQGDHAVLTVMNKDKSWQCSANGRIDEYTVFPSHYFVIA
tara:strand:+ start:91 stop:495 length:405 start_codon:yes stop_codon:yes gene_type:complete